MYELRLSAAELIFARGALIEQLERYSDLWRQAFIEYGAHVAAVYLPSINANRDTIAQIDELLI